MARNTLLAYMDFNGEFKIQTDASKFQLRAVISHKGKPKAIYSIRITDADKNECSNRKGDVKHCRNSKGI